MHRLLFIGVGGTGGKTLRFTWREIARRLRARGWQRSEMPAAFQFLHFDLPEQFDGYKDPDVPRVVSLDDKMYVHLAEKPYDYAHYDGQLTRTKLMHEAVAGWRPHPINKIPSPYTGAGQRRSVGRAVALCSLTEIDEALTIARTRLGSSEAGADMSELARHFAATQEGHDGHVFIVGSFSGGSGAGVFLDVIERVRAQAAQLDWLNNVHLIAVAPDVFQTLDRDQRPGAEPNSLAAVAEYIAAFGWEGDLHPREAELHGLARGTDQRTGGRAFMIGRGNATVMFANAGEVYRCIGKSLAAFATTPEIQQFFDGVVINYEGQTSGPPYFFASREGDLNQPFGSFGFGTVSLGRDLFAEYAAQRVARVCVNTLLSRGVSEIPLDEYVRQETGDRETNRFFEACGLWEYDLEDPGTGLGDGEAQVHDQVLDALRDLNELRKQTADVVRSVVQKLAKESGKRELPSYDETRVSWFKEFKNEFDEQEKVFWDKATAERSKRARTWTAEVQEQVLEATVEVCSAKGIPVAAALLRRLSDQLDDAAGQLAKQRQTNEARERQALSAARNLYVHAKDRITGAAARHSDAGERRQAALYQRLEFHARGEAAELLTEVRRGFIEPLRKTLIAYGESLTDEVADLTETGAGALIAQWPEEDVPATLRPAPNEQLLTDAGQFPGQYDNLLQTTLALSTPKAAQMAAVREVLRGGWLDRRTPGVDVETPQTLFVSDPAWNPGLEFAQRQGEPVVAIGDFQQPPDAVRLLDRARDWVFYRQGALSEYVDETLTKYLDRNHRDHSKRSRAFVTALGNAVSCARPLVTIDAKLHGKVHGGTVPKPSLTMTRLPIGGGHPAREAAERILSNAGIAADAVDGFFSTDSPVREIDIFGYLTKTVHPVVMSSLMTPISDEWGSASKTRETRDAFWNLRRARTLEMFIPISPTLQAALVQGWYTAFVLGYLRGLQASAGSEPKPEIWSPDGWLAFPSPMLGPAVERSSDVLPALLESVPLCFVDVSRGATDSTSAYGRLLELGGGRSGHRDELETWLRSGERPSGKGREKTPELAASLQSALGGSAPRQASGRGRQTRATDNEPAEARRKAVLAELAKPKARYEELEKQSLDRSVFTIDRCWEIAGLANAALDELCAFIAQSDLTTSEPTEPDTGAV